MERDVPEALRLVESFANSLDTETAQDDFAALAEFRGWLAAHDRPAAAGSATEADLASARELRAALRAELLAHHTGADEAERSAARAALHRLAARVPLHATFGPGPAGLAPAAGGVAGVLGEVLAAAVLAERDGHWHRLKICREDTCAVAYFDRSKNSSKTWCSMQVCGNRNKTRAYRGRRRQDPAAG